ncbi:hypothetical protein ACODT5_39195 [Streptomyces sp. 5.8]|uniref:hypothetical protein n=1 Tax=Streptomyces sp. 5.8 TaxID=3406571 RepID=UPI003BB4C4F5
MYRNLGGGIESQVTFRATGDRQEPLERHFVGNHSDDWPEDIAFVINAGRAEHLQ